MLKKLNLLQKKSKVLKKETSTKTKFIGKLFDYFNRDVKVKWRYNNDTMTVYEQLNHWRQLDTLFMRF